MGDVNGSTGSVAKSVQQLIKQIAHSPSPEKLEERGLADLEKNLKTAYDDLQKGDSAGFYKAYNKAVSEESFLKANASGLPAAQRAKSEEELAGADNEINWLANPINQIALELEGK